MTFTTVKHYLSFVSECNPHVLTLHLKHLRSMRTAEEFHRCAATMHAASRWHHQQSQCVFLKLHRQLYISNATGVEISSIIRDKTEILLDVSKTEMLYANFGSQDSVWGHKSRFPVSFRYLLWGSSANMMRKKIGVLPLLLLCFEKHNLRILWTLAYLFWNLKSYN